MDRLAKLSLFPTGQHLTAALTNLRSGETERFREAIDASLSLQAFGEESIHIRIKKWGWETSIIANACARTRFTNSTMKSFVYRVLPADLGAEGSDC